MDELYDEIKPLCVEIDASREGLGVKRHKMFQRRGT